MTPAHATRPAPAAGHALSGAAALLCARAGVWLLTAAARLILIGPVLAVVWSIAR